MIMDIFYLEIFILGELMIYLGGGKFFNLIF